jgi:O-antigen/teichoic acid export membrane protein
VEPDVSSGTGPEQRSVSAGLAQDVADGAARLPSGGLRDAADAAALKRSTTRGVAWQFAGAVWQTVVQVAASAVLARLLFPEDFGMLGMAVLVQGLVQRVGDLSAATGVIAKEEVSQADLSTAFWMSWAVQGALFVVAFAVAPWAAWFFETPDVAWVVRAISTTFLLTAAGTVSATLLRKELRFAALNVIDGVGFTFQSALAIVLVLAFDMNYWALVVAMLAANVLQTAATVLYARWRPSLVFDVSSFRHLFRYGIHGLGTSLVTYFHNNTDYLLVGKLLGPGMLGLYEFAYRIPHMAYNRLAVPVAGVMFPALSKVQTNNERLAAGYLKSVTYVSLVLFPALGGLAAVAGPAVAVIWGERWLPVVLPLQILCFRSAILSATSPAYAVFLCRDRPDIPFKFSLYTLAFTFAVVLGLGCALGLLGVAVGMLLSTGPSAVLFWLACRMTRTPLRRVLASLAPAAVSATVSSLLALATMHWTMAWSNSHLLALGLGILAGAAVYLLVIALRFGDTARDVFRTLRLALGQDPAPRAATPEVRDA